MNLKERMSGGEADLKLIITRLVALQGSREEEERERTLRALSAKIAELRFFVEDCLSGRSDHERAVLSYKLCIGFPLYSHLASLSMLPGDFFESLLRDFSLTTAAAR